MSPTTTRLVASLTIVLVGLECRSAHEGFRVDNRSDRRVVFVEISCDGDEVGEPTVLPSTSVIPGLTPCEGNPVIIREVNGEELFRYEPEEGCDETSTLVIPPTEPYIEPGD